MYKFTSFFTSTDSLPVVGGSVSAVAYEQISLLPPLQLIINTCVVAVIGGVVGYIVKLLLDKFFTKDNSKDKIEYR